MQRSAAHERSGRGHCVVTESPWKHWLLAVTLIAITGRGQEKDRQDTARAGFDHHRAKPVDPAQWQLLLRALQPAALMPFT